MSEDLSLANMSGAAKSAHFFSRATQVLWRLGEFFPPPTPSLERRCSFCSPPFCKAAYQTVESSNKTTVHFLTEKTHTRTIPNHFCRMPSGKNWPMVLLSFTWSQRQLDFNRERKPQEKSHTRPTGKKTTLVTTLFAKHHNKQHGSWAFRGQYKCMMY